jgi:hypothetical protein
MHSDGIDSCIEHALHGFHGVGIRYGVMRDELIHS